MCWALSPTIGSLHSAMWYILPSTSYRLSSLPLAAEMALRCLRRGSCTLLFHGISSNRPGPALDLGPQLSSFFFSLTRATHACVYVKLLKLRSRGPELSFFIAHTVGYDRTSLWTSQFRRGPEVRLARHSAVLRSRADLMTRYHRLQRPFSQRDTWRPCPRAASASPEASWPRKPRVSSC